MLLAEFDPQKNVNCIQVVQTKELAEYLSKDSDENIVFVAQESLTPEAKTALENFVNAALMQRTNCKVLEQQTVFTKEYVLVKMQDESKDNFTFAFVLHRAANKNLEFIEMVDVFLPVKFVPDFIDTLKSFAKKNKTAAGAKLERCVAEVTQKNIDAFKKKHGREPTKKERQNLESSAWAICRKSVGE